MRMFSSSHKNSWVLHRPSWPPLATPSPKNANSFLGSCADNPAAWDSKGHGPGSAAGRFGNGEHARNSPRLPTWTAKMELRFSCGATESLLNQDTLYPSAGEFGEILLAFLGTIWAPAQGCWIVATLKVQCQSCQFFNLKMGKACIHTGLSGQKGKQCFELPPGDLTSRRGEEEPNHPRDKHLHPELSKALLRKGRPWRSCKWVLQWGNRSETFGVFILSRD